MVHGSFHLNQLCKAGFIALFIMFNVSLTNAAGNTMTMYDVAKLKYATDVKLSPDGTEIAYRLRVQRNPFEEKDGPSYYELHVVDAEGNSRPFITGKVNVHDITWTPDGKRISYLAERNDDDHAVLYAISINGGESEELLEHKTGISSYSWSPDDKQVAFLAKSAKSEEEEKLEDNGFTQEIYEEDWRPDEIWIADFSSNSPQVKKLDVSGSASELHWSPDGKYLAVALAPTSLTDDHYMQRKVHILDVKTGEVVHNLENPGKLGQVTWSPDGQNLAIISGLNIHDPSAGRLMVASVQAGKLTNILKDYKGHVQSIAWKDDNTIVYVGNEGIWTTLNEIRKDGSKQKTLIEKGGPILSDLSLSKDGKAASFLGESPRHPEEVFYAPKVGKMPKRLTNSNLWLEKKRLAEQTPVSWKARDGLEIQGVLIKPLDYDENTRYPLILSVHGGPESRNANGWLTSYSDPGQVAAAQGIAVLYPNYRGSTGRGVEFSRLDYGKPAEAEFDDLVDGIDFLVNDGLVDSAKVGITGGSYGGYASAWGATYYSDRFAASVMFVGISDKISKTGTSDIPWELYLVHDPTWPWENWQHYLDASPIYHIEKAHTPLLILHGKEDPRVNPGQSMELYRFLKVRGTAPVRLVFYPGEKHGNSRAASRLDYSLRMMRWMNYYLKGPGGEKPEYQLEYNSEQLD